MFLDPTKKSIPKNLDECIAPNNTAKKLWSWSCKIDFIGLLAVTLEVILGLQLHLGILLTILCALITFISFNLFSLLLASLASFIQNNNVSTNLKIFKTYKEISASVVTDAPNSDNSNTAEEL